MNGIQADWSTRADQLTNLKDCVVNFKINLISQLNWTTGIRVNPLFEETSLSIPVFRFNPIFFDRPDYASPFKKFEIIFSIFKNEKWQRGWDKWREANSWPVRQLDLSVAIKSCHYHHCYDIGYVFLGETFFSWLGNGLRLFWWQYSMLKEELSVDLNARWIYDEKIYTNSNKYRNKI